MTMRWIPAAWPVAKGHHAALLFGSLLITTAGGAWGWGNEGHRVVAEVALAHLTPKAKAEVDTLLAGETRRTLPDVASWADEVRGDQRNTAAWHFINFRTGCHYVPAQDCPNGNCVVAAIERYAVVLGNRTEPPSNRTDALKWLTHLTGDIHQPLHVSDKSDKGGNTYQVQFDGRGTNLHHVWDTDLVRSIDSSDRFLASRLAPDAGAPIRFSDPSQFAPARWAEEGCQKVNSANLYPQGHTIDSAYVAANRALVEHQLQISGERLAAILNAELDP